MRQFEGNEYINAEIKYTSYSLLCIGISFIGNMIVVYEWLRAGMHASVGTHRLLVYSIFSLFNMSTHFLERAFWILAATLAVLWALVSLNCLSHFLFLESWKM